MNDISYITHCHYSYTHTDILSFIVLTQLEQVSRDILFRFTTRYVSANHQSLLEMQEIIIIIIMMTRWRCPDMSYGARE